MVCPMFGYLIYVLYLNNTLIYNCLCWVKTCICGIKVRVIHKMYFIYSLCYNLIYIL